MWLLNSVRFNVGLKIVAIITAVVAWTGVVYSENPPVSNAITKVIAQQSALIPAPFVLIRPISPIPLIVTGPKNDVASFTTADLFVSVNYTVIHATGEVSLPITITNVDPDVELLDAPTYVIADVDRLETATLPVLVKEVGTPPVGYTAGTVSVTPSTVSVVAPTHEISQLRATASVSLLNATSNIQTDAPVMITDTSGINVTDIVVSPTTVAVTIPITTSQSTRVTVVNPATYGALPAGYELSGMSVSPATVILTGPVGALRSITSVSTAPITLSDLTGNTTITVHIVTPAGVTSSQDFAVVSLTITILPTPPNSSSSPTPVPTPTVG